VIGASALSPPEEQLAMKMLADSKAMTLNSLLRTCFTFLYFLLSLCCSSCLAFFVLLFLPCFSCELNLP
jgi:hypothetical protein